MWLIIVFLVLFLIWFYFFMMMSNPYRTELVIGKKGSGKSTLITKQALYYKNHPTYIYYDKDEKIFVKRWKRAKWNIYSNVNLNIKNLDYILFKTEDLGKYYPLPHSVIFVDEVNLFWDNRKFKSFAEDTQTFFRTNRKCRCKLHLYSQSFDCDKKIRTLCDKMSLCSTFLGIWSINRQIIKVIDIKENALNADSQVVDNLKFAPLFVPGAFKLTFLPKYIKYHDSYMPMVDKPLLTDIRVK